MHETRKHKLTELYQEIYQNLQLFALFAGSEGYLSEDYITEKTQKARDGRLVLDYENQARFEQMVAPITAEFKRSVSK